MKNTSLMFGLIVGGISTAGCVVKTSSTSDPASPTTETAPASSPAAPAPASNPAPAQASAPASGAKSATATPAPSPTASPATPPPSRPPVASPASNKTTPALAAKETKPAQPAFTPPPKPKEKPKERKSSEAIGAPPNMHPGSPLAYWIWRDEKGNGWHLRTTTAGNLHRFSGRVWVDGTFSDLKPSTLELNDRLKKEDEGVVVFDFNTQGVIDGFDFQLAAGRCVTFHLLVDGKPAPKEVEIGRKEVPSGSPTFRLCQ